MQDRDAVHGSADAHLAVRIVHGVADVPVVQVIHDLLHCHDRAVVLRFLCGSAEVGRHDGVLHLHGQRIREIREVRLDLARGKGHGKSVLIHQFVSGEVEKDHAFLHVVDAFLADHARVLVRQRDVDRDVVAGCAELVQAGGMPHLAGQSPGAVDGKVGIIAVDIHAKIDGRIRDFRADGPEADDAQLLAADLRSDKLLLSLLAVLRHRRAVRNAADPLDAGDHVSGGDQHCAEHQLLHAVRVGAGGIEHHDALFRALLQRDVVDACAGSGDGQHVFRDLHLFHVRGTDQNSVRLLKILRQPVVIEKAVRADLRDRVEALDPEHHFASFSSKAFMKATSFSTPSTGIAL